MNFSKTWEDFFKANSLKDKKWFKTIRKVDDRRYIVIEEESEVTK